MAAKNTRKRTYDEAFLKLGFMEVNGKPKCVVCEKALSKESLKKNKLLRHLETNHPACVDKPIEYFRSKLQALSSQANVMKAFTTVNKSAVYASYLASYEIAKQKKAHTIGEKLILPVMKEVVKVMIGHRESEKLNSISLSDNTAKRRIEDMSSDVLNQIVKQVKASPFYAIQLDESTDVASQPQLSVFIRYVNNEEISEDMLFCKALPLHTKGEDIFQCLDTFFNEHKIPWDKCAGICTDGAAANTGVNCGVVKRVKDKVPGITWTHCFLHRQALAAKALSDTLDSVLKCVNYIKARPLNQRLFSCLCNEIGANHTSLLLHTEVRWLSRGHVLKRVVELQEEIITFLKKQKKMALAEKFSQEKFMANVTYLADIFDSLNSLNQSMQGPGFTVIDHNAKINAYYKKLILWQSYVKKNKYDMFPQLKAYLSERNVNVQGITTKHLEQLIKKLKH